MSRPAWQFLVGTLSVLLLALLAGLIAGRPVAFVAVALALLLARHCVSLLRFDRWLRTRATRPAPHFGGLWGEVVAIVDRVCTGARSTTSGARSVCCVSFAA